MSLEYERLMPGMLWAFSGEVESDATATIRILATPSEGSEMEILYGRVTNNGAAGRVVNAVIRDEDSNVMASLIKTYTLGNGASVPFPNSGADLADDGPNQIGTRYILGSDMNFIVTMAAALTTEEMDVEMVCRFTGDKPAATFTVSTGAITSATRMDEVY